MQDYIFFLSPCTRKKKQISVVILHVNLVALGQLYLGCFLVFFILSPSLPSSSDKNPSGGVPSGFSLSIPRGGLGKPPHWGSEGGFEPSAFPAPDGNAFSFTFHQAGAMRLHLLTPIVRGLSSSCLWHSTSLGLLLYF